MRSLLIAALVLLPTAAIAQTPTIGAAMAERWCMGCHVVEPGAFSDPNSRVPTFSAIASRPGTTAASLDRYLSAGHTRMPDFALTRTERDALVSYILSLRRRP